MTTTDLPALPDLTQMELECKQLPQCKGNLTSLEVASIQDFLYSVPQQLELKVTHPDQKFDVFFDIMNSLITKKEHYGLFQQVVKGNTQSSFYLLSPTTTQIIEENRAYYDYRQWLKKTRETGFASRPFQKQSLRSLARYLVSKNLDKQAEGYYKTYMEYKYWRWLELYNSFGEAQLNLLSRLADLAVSDSPYAYKAIEIDVVGDLMKRMSSELGLTRNSYSPPFHLEFIRTHTRT